MCALVVLAFAGGCGGGSTQPDAGIDAGAEVGIDAGPVDDAAAPADGDGGGDADGGDVDAGADAVPGDFVAISPCAAPGAYVIGVASIGTLGNMYSPACARVQAGSSVTIEASVTHPLEPRAGGSVGNPIPPQTSNATVVFTTPGFYPFLCPEHVDQGMIGVVWVTP